MNISSFSKMGMAELSARMMASFMSSIEVVPSSETKNFECARYLASGGHVEQALDMLQNYLDAIYDDEYLFGQNWNMLSDESDSGKLLNSIGLLYSCRYAEAEDIRKHSVNYVQSF